MRKEMEELNEMEVISDYEEDFDESSGSSLEEDFSTDFNTVKAATANV